MTTATFPALLQTFFTDRLVRQLRASPHTVAAYRDTFRLLLRYAVERRRQPPTKLLTESLDANFIGKFLDHLESKRGNSARTRNMRLAAIRSFFRYVAICEPAYALQCERILSMPDKRHERRPVPFLSRPEVEALLDAPSKTTWTGRRDRVLLLVAVQTGLRVSELIALRRQDVSIGPGAHLRCQGKGRKERCTPLRRDAVAALADWLKKVPGGDQDPVFATTRGRRLSRDAIERIVAKHTKTAASKCPSLAKKRVTPHVLRHTAAMDLLQHGVDRAVIALWLGHESVETTQIYLHADMNMKEAALSRTVPFNVARGRYHPNDQLLAFLEGL
jgi:site-specific recombinase XerD